MNGKLAGGNTLLMICPHCKEETKNGKACEKCGKELAHREVEVQYKDFKVTELLDIRMPGQAPAGKEGGNPQTDKKTHVETPKREKQPAEKRSHLVLVAVFFLLAVAVGYYLLKMLMKF